jgi:hypothetical protein
MRPSFRVLLLASLLLGGCAPSEDAREARFEEELDAIAARVHTAYPNGLVEYSAWPEDADGLPVDNLDEVAVAGPVVFTAKHDPFYGPGADYRSATLHSPTWLDVVGVANESVQRTGDRHHIFLEALEDTGTREHGARVFVLQFGS